MKKADLGRVRARIAFLLLPLSLIMGVPIAASGAVALSDLLEPGGSLVVGDALVFDQFTFSGTGDLPSTSGVLVQEMVDGDGNFGLRIFSGLSFGPIDTNMNLGFRVSTTDGSLLTGSTLSGNPALITESNDATLSIASTLGGTSLTIFDNLNDTLLLDAAALPTPGSSVDVDLTIDSFIPTEPGGRSVISFIDQTFEQGDNNVVPEPASVVIWLGTMLVAGVIPVTYRRCQRAKTQAAS